MKSTIYFPGVFMILVTLFSLCCCEKEQKAKQTAFTKADSLTESYLALKDSLLQTWNTMMHDDNRKIKAMQHLLHELAISNPEKQEALNQYEHRLQNLADSRYDQNSISNTEVVTEYDFASNSLVTELISLAESENEFAYNTTLQKLADDIRASDQRVNNYREDYDFIASEYNRFIVRNRQLLKEIDENPFQDTTPLFQMAAE